MFGVIEGAAPGETDDLATLAKLDEKILLNELKLRYEKQQIYVSHFPHIFVCVTSHV
jgi:myosin heavy subunit